MNSKYRLMSKFKSFCIITAGGTSIMAVLSVYNESEPFYNNVLMPFAHLFSPETSHKLAILANKYKLLPRSRYVDPDIIKTNFLGMSLQNPIGIAAGFDKQGEGVQSLHDLGFGFVEVGSVTPEPQQGNPKPRVFRLPSNLAIINRYGFNSDGHEKVLKRLQVLKGDPDFKGIIGVNLGKNKNSDDPISDYVKGIEKFGRVADYLVINISSPNTPGLRSMQQRDILGHLLSTLIQIRDSLECENKPPLLLKLAPDLSYKERRDIAKILNQPDCKIDGLIISNTTVERDILDPQDPHINETGGLSGQPLSDMSTSMIREMYMLTGGKYPIIGVGGIFSGKDAYEKILAGASVVQLYTAFAYYGPPIISKIKEELSNLLSQDGYKSIKDAVGRKS
uniref:Dihydroorotate dehydrogenase (quinone), mitochondrial n=1 Tax=Xenopsylla cheopis TaxID=163159 RepID=A0A6M2DGL2_XENCH